MIVYFSGTGNSRHVASYLSHRLNDSLYMVADAPQSMSCDVVGVVTPVYSWGIPPIILEYIRRLTFTALPKYVWVVLCCGDEVGLAHKMIQRAFLEKGISVNATMSIQMPNNYVLLPGFDVDSKAVEKSKLDNAPRRLSRISEIIESSVEVEDVVVGSMAWLKTTLVYPLFKRLGIFPGKWRVDMRKCVKCGKCAEVCPVGNVKLNQYPVWGANCTSCLACYHVCGRKAVSYAGATKNKGQYFHP